MFLPMTRWSDCCCQLQMISLRWKGFKVHTVLHTHVESPFCPHDTTAHGSHQAKRFVIRLAYIPFSCPPLPLCTSPCLPCHPHAVTRAAVICCSHATWTQEWFLGIKRQDSTSRSPFIWILNIKVGMQGIFYFLEHVSFCRCGGWWAQTAAAQIWLRSYSTVPRCVYVVSEATRYSSDLLWWCFAVYSSQENTAAFVRSLVCKPSCPHLL